jgi:hypothetical protein
MDTAQGAGGDPGMAPRARAAAAALASYFPDLDEASDGSGGLRGVGPEEQVRQATPGAVVPLPAPPGAQHAQHEQAVSAELLLVAPTPPAEPTCSAGGQPRRSAAAKVLGVRPAPSAFAAQRSSPDARAPSTVEQAMKPPSPRRSTPTPAAAAAAAFPRAQPDIEQPGSPASPFAVTPGGGHSPKDVHTTAEVGAAAALRHQPPLLHGAHKHTHTHRTGDSAITPPSRRAFAEAYAMPPQGAASPAHRAQPQSSKPAGGHVGTTRASAAEERLQHADRRATAVANAAAGFLAAVRDPEQRRAARKRVAREEAEAAAQAARRRSRNPDLHWGGSDESD